MIHFATNDKHITTDIIDRYTSYLLDGHTITNSTIKSGTIQGYLQAVNSYYESLGLNPPYNRDSHSFSARILKEQKDYDKQPQKRDPLHYKVIATMYELARSAPPASFERAVWLWTALGRLGGFRCQEFAMDKQNAIRVYVKPDGSHIVRAFTLKNFIFYNNDSIVIPWQQALALPDTVTKFATEYDIQKNRVNGQLITFARDNNHPKLCPVLIALEIVRMATELGATNPFDPLAIYKDDCNQTPFLTGAAITSYYRYVTKLTFPNIPSADLMLISTHSIRVTACVLLHEAGMDGTYIKLRLRWKSDCFEIYLRNTTRITTQHNSALSYDNNDILAAITNITSNILPVEPIDNLVLDFSFPDLLDED